MASSRSRRAFDANLIDIERLIDFYQVACEMEKTDEGEEPFQLKAKDVVLRSAMVLLVTYWESYIEDVVAEAIDLIVKRLTEPDKLPADLKKIILKELSSEKHELAGWKIAGEGWRKLLTDRLPRLAEVRNRNFNTPKAQQTKEFLKAALGIEDVTHAWEIDGKSATEIAAQLDEIIEIRGAIAHRGKAPKEVTEESVTEASEFIKKLVAKTGGRINSQINEIAGVSLWK